MPYVGTRKFQSLNQFYSFADNIHEYALHWKGEAEMLPNDAFFVFDLI